MGWPRNAAVAVNYTVFKQIFKSSIDKQYVLLHYLAGTKHWEFRCHDIVTLETRTYSLYAHKLNFIAVLQVSSSEK